MANSLPLIVSCAVALALVMLALIGKVKELSEALATPVWSDGALH